MSMEKRSKYTNDFVPVRAITNGMIILDNDEKVTGVKIFPRNIFILDPETRNMIINNLKGVYNLIDYEFWTDEHCEHPRPGEALGVDKGVHAHPGEDEDRPRQVDAEIVVGIAEGLPGGPGEAEDGALEGIAQGREAQGEDEQEAVGVAHDAPGLLLVALPAGDGEEGGAAGGAEGLEGADDHEDGGGDADPRQGQLPALGHVADVDPVHDAVEGVHQQRQGQRPGQAEDIPRQAALGEITFVRLFQRKGLLP